MCQKVPPYLLLPSWSFVLKANAQTRVSWKSCELAFRITQAKQLFANYISILVLLYLGQLRYFIAAFFTNSPPTVLNSWRESKLSRKLQETFLKDSPLFLLENILSFWVKIPSICIIKATTNCLVQNLWLWNNYV